MEHLVKVKGLYTYPSEVTEVPEGALSRAVDIVIDRDSVFECRPGFKNYATVSATSSDRGKQTLVYKNTVLNHTNTTLAYDNAGTLVSYSGSYSAPTHGDSYIPKIRGQEMNSNFYFTSSLGIQKLDSLTSTPVNSGAPQGLDLTLALNAAGSGFLTASTACAYQVVWGYRDLNNNLILGAPSQRTVIVNTAGTTKNIDLNFSIPSTVTTAWFYQIYRSGISASASADPADDQQLVYEANPTSTDISNKFVTVTDSTPDALRGAALYTNSSQEGAANANNQPPSAKDIALFKNTLFYANTLHKQNKTITLLSSGGASGVSVVTFTGNITNGSPTVLSASTTVGVAIGQSITGTGIPASTTITNIVGTTLTLSANATATTVGVSLTSFDVITIDGLTYSAAAAEDTANRKFQVYTSGTAAQNIAATAQSLCKCINRATANTTIYAYYISGVGALPGKIYLEARALGYSTFYVTASSNTQAWNPQLPTSGTTIASTKDEFKHYLYFSKLNQPEAVPLLNFIPVGAADEPILRIIPLRDSLIIMKGDGVYRLTGTSSSTFDVNILDNTVKLLAPETAVRLNNQIHALTNQLVATITDTGVGVISRPIEDQLLSTLQYTNLATSAFAVGYESAHKYILWMPTSSSATYAAHSYVYNTFTQAWFEWSRAATSGAVNPGDDKLYFTSGTANTLLQQRKTGTFLDFCDEETTVTISAVNGTQVVVSDATSISVGDGMIQGAIPYANVSAVDLLTNTVTLDATRSWSLGSATFYKAISSQVSWSPQYCQNPGLLKQIRELSVLIKDKRFKSASLTFTTNIVKSVATVPLTGFNSFQWGYFAWGSIPWGGNTDPDRLRTWIPANYQRCSWILISFLHSKAFGRFAINGLVLFDNQASERTGTS